MRTIRLEFDIPKEFEDAYADVAPELVVEDFFKSDVGFVIISDSVIKNQGEMMEKFKYLVLGNHPILRYVNKRCLSLKEAEIVTERLSAIGYEVTIEQLGGK